MTLPNANQNLAVTAIILTEDSTCDFYNNDPSKVRVDLGQQKI